MVIFHYALPPLCFPSHHMAPYYFLLALGCDAKTFDAGRRLQCKESISEGKQVLSL